MALGCFAENMEAPDFEFYAWDRTLTGDATIENCVHACRTRAFAYAALRVRIIRLHGRCSDSYVTRCLLTQYACVCVEWR